MKALMDKVTDWAARFAGAQASMHELSETDRAIREAHGAAVRTRDALVSAPPPTDEVVAAMEAEVDRGAAAWATERAHGIVTSFGPGLDLKMDGTLQPRRPQSPDWFFTPLTFHEIAAAFPELVKPRLAALIRGYAYAAGPAQADRARRVADADAKIREIEKEHTALVDLAAKFDPPIVLALLPAVRARREAEAETTKRNAAAEADRRAREVVVDQRHEGRNVVHSPYVTQPTNRRGL